MLPTSKKMLVSMEDARALWPVTHAFERGWISASKFRGLLEDWVGGARAWDPRELGGSEPEVITWDLGKHPGSTSEQVATRTGLPAQRVRELAAKMRRRGLLDSSKGRPRTWFVRRPDYVGVSSKVPGSLEPSGTRSPR